MPMNMMQKTAGNAFANNIGKQIKGGINEVTTPDQKGGNPNVNWNDFNWPPLINICHFDLEDCTEKNKPIMTKIHWGWRLLWGLVALNFINSIIQVATGSNGLKILSSIIIAIVYMCFMTYMVFISYKGFLLDQRKLMWYKIGSMIFMLLLLCSCIFPC